MPPQTAAYDGVVAENRALKKRVKQLEKAARKKQKRAPNAYQKAWKAQYPIELAHAKSEWATKPKEEWLRPYCKRYGDNLSTAPNPKSGEALLEDDRSTFMKNISARAKREAAAAPPQSGSGPPTGLLDDDGKAYDDAPPSPRGVDELFD